MNSKDDTKSEPAKDERYSAPSVSLPKGGGAIKGIGEKFAANPVTGTGSLTIPLPLSPGRSGFSPALSLSYDSGAGNGPFGFGWSVGYPTITRRTDKGIPRYFDHEESDVFILSGAEDLVPDTSPHAQPPNGYRVTCYRPRIEGLFARIERWTNLSDSSDTFWRSISRDNVTTFYGKTIDSRIADPTDPSRIFSWLICQSYDDKGNAVIYEYEAENSHGIVQSQVHEKNRTAESRGANRYLKWVKYGNREPNRDQATWQAKDPTELANETWMFELVFDYGEGHYSEEQPDVQDRVFAKAQINPPEGGKWPARPDPFSSYRAGFEVRTYRLCQRVLMFHHFPLELGTPDCLVRSTEFTYNSGPIASFITEVAQSGYVRQADDKYLKKSFPPLNLQYSKAVINDEIQTIDAESLRNLPIGVDGLQYQWLDLDGEGLQGVLSEQPGAWYYKRNLSPIAVVTENEKEKVVARLAPVAEVETLPSLAEGAGGHHQFLDLAGDGSLDFVQFEKPVAGFFERTDDERWESFIPFDSLPNLAWNDPNLRFIDLTGDGHADILITEDHALTWYPSLAEQGFERAIRIPTPLDEEKGPAVVFADGTQAVVVADFSGDGLTDIVRIRNGEICYWPNLGYGRFGAKVTMDNAPRFDAPDQFDQKRIRLADIDGSGTTDIIYLERHRVAIYRNECGNAWSAAEYLDSFPAVDNLASVTTVDLLGIGTACLVWSSPLPGHAPTQMRYIDLMGRQKPHLLTRVTNNLGAETVVEYAPSTKFYLADKLAGKPWITRLPFPVHVAERVVTHDLISRNRFVSRYNYHHGYFDGIEREFRGFGMVEQWDTEELTSLRDSEEFGEATNIDAPSYVPPVLTRTWFHTGAYLEGERISRHFEDEYYREGDESEDVQGLSDEQLQAMLLPDTKLPNTLKLRDGSSTPWNLNAEEVREACRALKGSILRQEVYANDGTGEADRPYTASERNYTIELLQPQGRNKNAVFFVHPREAIEFHYERKLFEIDRKRVADPRVTHALTLEVDEFGNVLKSVAIGYGRRHEDTNELLTPEDREKQERVFVTYNENAFTNPINEPDNYRTRLPCEARTYELVNRSEYLPPFTPHEVTELFDFDEMRDMVESASDGHHDLLYENLEAVGTRADQTYRRPIEQIRTLYREDDLTALLPLGLLKMLALPGENYKLAFTPGLLSSVYKRGSTDLRPDFLGKLGSKDPDGGGYLQSNDLKTQGLFPGTDPDDHWWIPSGRVYFSRDVSEELSEAREHFFLPRRFVDPFDQSAFVDYDGQDLLVESTTDAVGNLIQADNDYRVLQPKLVVDPNLNQTEVAFDALGMVAGTAVMGRNNGTLGDLLDASFQRDPVNDQLEAFLAKPREEAANPDESVATPIVHELLAKATTRIVYDLDRFKRLGEPPFSAAIARETHVSDLHAGQITKIQISFSYSDGFGREIQKKVQAEPGPVPMRDYDGRIIIGPDRLPVMTANAVRPRWVGSGWTVFNNKGKPVRHFEPFFTDRHRFEFDVRIGVSPVLFYDPVERVVATLHPDHTWEKVVFDPWQQVSFDVNDTLKIDPKLDDDVTAFFTRLPDEYYLPSWSSQAEPEIAQKAAKYADTPALAYLDSLGRTFLTVAHNTFDRETTANTIETIEEKYSTRVELDIEGNQRQVFDAGNRIVMKYDYDMLGSQIHQASMEAGERWVLNDVTGKPIRAWDSRHMFRTEYDPLRRPKQSFVSRSDPQNAMPEICFGVTVYGEEVKKPPSALNLRGHVLLHCDGAGAVVNVDRNPETHRDEAYDFKGNPLRTTRRLAREYKENVNWHDVDWDAVKAALTADPFKIENVLQPLAPMLETEPFTSSVTYDALNRPTTSTAPDKSVYRPTFNEANLLEKVDVNLRGEGSTPFVTNINYNARGQRELISYGNGAETSYDYDDRTFRLIHLKTTRPAADDSPLFENPSIVQDLNYQYDPAGNITRIEDAALKIVFNNGSVEPVCEYTYDATYRLIEARGREHIGQTTHVADWQGCNRRDFPFAGSAHPNDLQAMRKYIEGYEYDEVGNFRVMRHSSNDGSWTRTYDYEERSLLEHEQKSNRLTRTRLGNGVNYIETYTYLDALGQDVHGCMTAINDMKMEWNFKDQLRQVNLGGCGTAYYVYDAAGQRTRKVIESQNGVRQKERIYLGNFERYREFQDNGANVKLKRETLHVMDAKLRIALVETKTIDNGNTLNPPDQIIRYQLSNHLGSSSVELNDQAQLISYEEYHPYGTSSFQAGQAAEVSLKQYRYTEMERDQETGFSYHGARYYATWLGRWISCDPIMLGGGMNLFSYCSANPIIKLDVSGTDEWCGLTDGFFGIFSSECHVAPGIVNAGKAGVGAMYGAGKTVVGGVFAVGKATYYTTAKVAYDFSGKEIWKDQAATYDRGIAAIAETFESGVGNAAKNYVKSRGDRFMAAVDAGNYFDAGEAFGEPAMELALLADAAANGPKISASPAPALATQAGRIIQAGGRIVLTAPAPGPLAMAMAVFGDKASKEAPSKTSGKAPRESSRQFSGDNVPYQVTGLENNFKAVKGTGVYVLKDAQGKVLYVGEGNVFDRLRAHISDPKKTPWFGEISKLEVQATKLSKKEALALEEDLIDQLKPLHNEQLKPFEDAFPGQLRGTDLPKAQPTMRFDVNLGKR